MQGKIELDESDVVHVPYSCRCSSSSDASYGTRRDQPDLDACKAASVHVDTSPGQLCNGLFSQSVEFSGYKTHKRPHSPGTLGLIASYHFVLTREILMLICVSLLMQVLGNAKGAVAVVISILIFQNPVTVMGIGGYSITVLGVVAYGETKRRFR